MIGTRDFFFRNVYSMFVVIGLLLFLPVHCAEATNWVSSGTNITNSGQVGIGAGSTPPISPLDVSGVATFRNQIQTDWVNYYNGGAIPMNLGAVVYLWQASSTMTVGSSTPAKSVLDVYGTTTVDRVCFRDGTCMSTALSSSSDATSTVVYSAQADLALLILSLWFGAWFAVQATRKTV